MKKYYLQPQLTIVSLAMRVSVLAGSAELKALRFGGRGVSNDEAESHGYEGGLVELEE